MQRLGAEDTYSGTNQKVYLAGGSIPGRSGRSSAVGGYTAIRTTQPATEGTSSKANGGAARRRIIGTLAERRREQVLHLCLDFLHFGALDPSQLHLNGSRRSAHNGGYWAPKGEVQYWFSPKKKDVGRPIDRRIWCMVINGMCMAH